jgi:hypothetical protein
MQWNDHWRIEGKHARVSASKHHWVNYDMAKFQRFLENARKAEEGTALHTLAKLLIRHRIKQIRDGSTFRTYVNDAIGFHMDPEVPLYYSDEFFGTPDAISFREKTLRIHDLKTGTFPGHINQLKIYAALFFLEYGRLYRVKPHDVQIRLRIYQNDGVIEIVPEPEEIVAIMEKGKLFAEEAKAYEEVMMA